MQRTLASVLLAAPLIAACGTPAPPDEGQGEGSGGAPSATPGGEPSETAHGGDEATPPREPSRFAPGGAIPDERLGDYHVALTCSVDGEDAGTMTFALWADQAPITVRNFLRLCDEGFYDGVIFHRVMRDFMVQGGDPTGTGSGSSDYGTIQAEFSDAPERAHGYGVLSMARSRDPNSASCQFFIITDDGPGAWGLDGGYASFGRLTSGVATLETLADVETTMTPRREKSVPTSRVAISKAEVREGAAPVGETIARPQRDLDLGDAPHKVVVQHALISFQGASPRVPATRSKEEAAALAGEILQKVRDGEDFEALLREHSDDPVQEGDTTPGVYRLLNDGVRDSEAERAMFQMSRDFQARGQELQERTRSGELTSEQAQVQFAELQEERRATTDALMWMPRSQMVSGFGDVAFSLAVGEVGMAGHDPVASPFGWHVINRLE